jgi:ubiquinone/menaquinone biosynthesis C-methylase UbiE
MFYRLAPYYDALISAKDTRHEVAYLERLVARFGRSGGRAWLDVACGTGRHLELLRPRFRVVGVDLSPAMLRIARRRLPSVRLLQGDMRTLRVPGRFDVVTCLFSAIGHLRSEHELSRALANFSRHLKPGGVCIIEPWIDPAQFRPGHVHLVSQVGASGAVARMSFARRRGNRSIIHYEYLVGDPRNGVRHFAEDDVGLLVDPTRLRDLVAAAGLKPRLLRRGLTPGRGLVLGVKPVERTRGRGRPRESSPGPGPE